MPGKREMPGKGTRGGAGEPVAQKQAGNPPAVLGAGNIRRFSPARGLDRGAAESPVISVKVALRGLSAPGGSFMRQRTVFGWLLAGAFCAAVSCGGGGNGSSTPQGFGVPCKASKDCATYDLVCGPDKKCVQCLGDAICESGQVCSAGLCKTQDDCTHSRDCSGSQVCDEDAGVCVDCLTSRDCAEGQKCADHTCSDRPVCEFTSDCADGLVCLIDPGVCVSCRDDDDCSSTRVCEDYECVVPEPVSSGGKSGTAGSGGKSGTAGGGGRANNGGTGGTTSVAGTATGGTGGKAGAGGMSGSGGSVVGESGAGGAGEDCGCLATQACTPDLRCVSSTLVDDLLDCDDQILPIAGRQGDWAAEADTGIGFSYGFDDPGAGWTDRSCAAWATGDELTVDDPAATFAFVGFRLNVDDLDEGLAYDLSQYNGIQIQLETKASVPTSVQVVVKTTGGGYFQVTLSPVDGALYTRSASFAAMSMMDNSAELVLDPSTIYEVQFSVVDPSAFAFAIHRVALY